MMRYTAFSLPGIREDASNTVSPSPTSILWSRLAIRESAAIGSPWEPVQIDDDAVLSQHHPVTQNTGLDGQSRVGNEVTPLAMDRHNIARLDDVVAVEQLAGTGMTG